MNPADVQPFIDDFRGCLRMEDERNRYRAALREIQAGDEPKAAVLAMKVLNGETQISER